MTMHIANPREYTDELTTYLAELLDTKSTYKCQFISVENMTLKYHLH